MGRLQGAFGVKGWMRVLSFTEPVETILTFPVWWINRHGAGAQHTRMSAQEGAFEQLALLSGRKHRRGVVALFEGIDSPEAVRRFVGYDVWIPRDRLDEPEAGSHYWADLVGSRVMTDDGHVVGVVTSLFETGANDVVVVQEPDGGERLLPFTHEVIRNVDTRTQTVTVSLLPGM